MYSVTRRRRTVLDDTAHTCAARATAAAAEARHMLESLRFTVVDNTRHRAVEVAFQVAGLRLEFRKSQRCPIAFLKNRREKRAREHNHSNFYFSDTV